MRPISRSGRATSRSNLIGGDAFQRESGQAATEFALILVPMLILIGGIIFFGIGLNYWLDMNRVANQGARWAAVNNWPPQCARTETSCVASNSGTSCATVMATGSRARLQDVIRCSLRNRALNTPLICYPGKAPGNEVQGDPVKVKLTAPYKFWFMRSVGITLTATATMRLEQPPTLITNEVSSC